MHPRRTGMYNEKHDNKEKIWINFSIVGVEGLNSFFIQENVLQKLYPVKHGLQEEMLDFNGTPNHFIPNNN